MGNKNTNLPKGPEAEATQPDEGELISSATGKSFCLHPLIMSFTKAAWLFKVWALNRCYHSVHVSECRHLKCVAQICDRNTLSCSNKAEWDPQTCRGLLTKSCSAQFKVCRVLADPDFPHTVMLQQKRWSLRWSPQSWACNVLNSCSWSSWLIVVHSIEQAVCDRLSGGFRL